MATEKRLIDKQTAVKLLRGKCVAKYPSTFLMGLLASATEIEQLPEVDAVEVVHGRWIAVPSSDMMTGKAYKCSECNKMRYGSFMPNYCSHCGAKMDGETHEQ